MSALYLMLGIITGILILSIFQRAAIARQHNTTLEAHTFSMDELNQTLNVFIDEVRSVQTYGLRLQK